MGNSACPSSQSLDLRNKFLEILIKVSVGFKKKKKKKSNAVIQTDSNRKPTASFPYSAIPPQSVGCVLLIISLHLEIVLFNLDLAILFCF